MYLTASLGFCCILRVCVGGGGYAQYSPRSKCFLFQIYANFSGTWYRLFAIRFPHSTFCSLSLFFFTSIVSLFIHPLLPAWFSICLWLQDRYLTLDVRFTNSCCTCSVLHPLFLPFLLFCFLVFSSNLDCFPAVPLCSNDVLFQVTPT